MLSLDQLRWRLAEKGYCHRQVEKLLREIEGAAVPVQLIPRLVTFMGSATVDSCSRASLRLRARPSSQHL